MLTRTTRSAMLAVLLLVLLPGRFVAAKTAFTYTAQARSVSAMASLFGYDPPPLGPVPQSMTNSGSASDFGDFNSTVSADMRNYIDSSPYSQ